MEITGVIKIIKPEQQIGETFKKREFVVSTMEQYSQSIQLELHGDKTDIIDAYIEGQEVKCSINIRGKEWINPQGEAKYFNTLVCWKIQPLNQENQQNSEQYTPPQPENTGDQFLNMKNEPKEFKPNYEANDEEEPDLPFK